jgi:hypothetical protein
VLKLSNIIDKRSVVNMDYSLEKPKNNYPMNDLGSVYTHYDPVLHKNVTTPNTLSSKEDINNGKDSK